MKKSIISLCAVSLIGASTLSYAMVYTATTTDLNAGLATKPSFEFTAGVLYLQPSSNNLDYAVHGYPFPVLSPHWDVAAVRPSYSTGFDIRGRYFIPCTDFDVGASWDYLNTSDSDFTQVSSTSGEFVTFPFQAGPSFGQILNNPSQKAHSNVKFNYDVVNLNVGENFSFGPAARVRLYVGVSGAELKQKISTTFGDNANTYSINSTNNSRFDGIGPMVGMDGNYGFENGFGFFGTLAFSALIGNLDAITTYRSTSPQLTASGIALNTQSISPRNSLQGIPGVDGKLGIDFNARAGTNLIISAALGYEYVNYFNAIATYNPSLVAANVNTGSIALSSLSKTVSNYTLQGPFLNISLLFLTC